MQPLSRVTPDELSSLVMENELLRYEATHLRARLTAAEKALTRARRELDGGSEGAGGGRGTGAGGVDPATVRADLEWLLSRVESAPLGRVLARGPRMAELRRRYLGEAPR